MRTYRSVLIVELEGTTGGGKATKTCHYIVIEREVNKKWPKGEGKTANQERKLHHF